MAAEIPGFDQTPKFSSQVPGVTFPMRGAGEAGEEIERAGHEIGQGGAEFGRLLTNIQDIHDTATAQNAATQAQVQMGQVSRNLSQSSGDGYSRDSNGNLIDDPNTPGQSRTIAHDAWDQSDQIYMNMQHTMTDNAAAKFREIMIPHMGLVTREMQGIVAKKQVENTEFQAQQQLQTKGQDLLQMPFIPGADSYNDKFDNGAINIRPSQAKIIQALNDQTKIRMGMSSLNPLQQQEGLKADNSILSEHGMAGLFNSAIESNPEKKFQKAVPQTTLQGIQNLKDMIRGIDPESMANQAAGKQTIHTAMAPDRQNSWLEKLDAFHDQALAIDKHDMELQMKLIHDKAEAGGYQNKGKQAGLDAYFQSPEVQHVLGMASAQGVSSAEVESGLVSGMQAAFNSGLPSGTDLLPMSKAIGLVSKRTQDSMKAFEQNGQMISLPYLQGMGAAVIGNASNAAISRVKKQDEDFHKDPADYFKQPADGQSIANGIKFRDSVVVNAEDQLNRDPSYMGLLKKSATGKSITETLAERQTINQRLKGGQGFDPIFLSKSTSENQANLIKEAGKNNAGGVDNFLQQLVVTPHGPQMLHQLVTVGGLPPQFEAAVGNLSSASARREMIQEGSNGPLALDQTGPGMPSKETMKGDFNKAFGDVLSAMGKATGGNAGDLLKNSAYWQSSYMQKVGKLNLPQGGGLSYDDASKQAIAAIKSGMPTIQNTNEPSWQFLHPGSWTHQKQVPILMTNDRGDQPDSARERANIVQNLTNETSIEKFAQRGVTVDPREVAKQNQYDFTNKLTGQYAFEHGGTWYPARTNRGQVYRYKIEGTDASGNPTGNFYDAKIPDGKGGLRNLEFPKDQLKLDAQVPKLKSAAEEIEDKLGFSKQNSAMPQPKPGQ